MIVWNLVGVALAEDTPSDAGEKKPAEPPGYALSVGTGPRPLNTLTLGLTGMGARLLLPAEGLYPWFSLAYNNLSLTDGTGDGRYVTGLSTWTVALGVRSNVGKGPDFTGVDPYVGFGVFANRAGVKSGEPVENDWYKTNGMTFGASGAFGLEGFLTPHLSVGLEVGATAGRFSGGEDGGNDASALLVSSLSAAQLTVWK